MWKGLVRQSFLDPRQPIGGSTQDRIGIQVTDVTVPSRWWSSPASSARCAASLIQQEKWNLGRPWPRLCCPIWSRRLDTDRIRQLECIPATDQSGGCPGPRNWGFFWMPCRELESTPPRTKPRLSAVRAPPHRRACMGWPVSCGTHSMRSPRQHWFSLAIRCSPFRWRQGRPPRLKFGGTGRGVKDMRFVAAVTSSW
jgi:hypothetical protein